MWRLLPVAVAAALASTPSLADQNVPLDVSVRVGSTKRL